MIIEEKISLDFNDVLLKPKRSTLTSRKDVDLIRTYKFKNSGVEWTGVGIMAANMDGVGTFSMAMELQKHKMLTVITKHATIKQWDKAFKKGLDGNHVIPCIGTAGIWDSNAEDLKTLDHVISYYDDIKFICIDVANGYHENFGDFVENIHLKYPDKALIAGNVITREMTEELIIRGADIVKCGIGPGCFEPETLIHTRKGLIPIKDIKIGDIVKTHLGNDKKVINKLKYTNDIGKIISINGIKSTPKHEYYVLDKKYKDIVNDDNIHEYAEWIEAKYLDKEKYFLIKHVE